MADPQDRPDSEPDGTPAAPRKKPPAKAVKKAAKAPAAKAAAKKAPAKKAPAKKAPAKKGPVKAVDPTPPGLVEQPVTLPQRIETNGQLAAAKDAAAQAKATVEDADNPVPPDISAPSQFRTPLLVAVALSVLATLLVRQLRSR